MIKRKRLTDRERLAELLDENIVVLKLKNEPSPVVWKDEKAKILANILIANGVIYPPCKVGDTVYVISNEEVQETTVFSMKAETDANHYVFFIKAKAVDGTHKTVDGYETVFGNFMFGITAFRAREEAEKALAERSNQ